MSWLGRIFGIMLKRLHLRNFTVFADADFEFGPGLNVLVGTNGTGKSHVLKVGYAAAQTWYHDALSKKVYGGAIRAEAAFSLRAVLSPLFVLADIGKLVRYGQQKAKVDVTAEDGANLMFTMASAIEDGIGISADFATSDVIYVAPIFIPAKEVLTLSWMLPASGQLERLTLDSLSLEQNYLDLLGQLRGLRLREPPAPEAIQTLTEILGGELRETRDNYYLVDNNGRELGANLLAEGLRKFGMLQKLLLNGSLTEQTTLFWDEPEANLNPALLRKLAAILAELARQGFQIILATHSTDLLKEFHILSRQKDAKPLPIKYFGLNARQGEATTIVTTDNFEYLPDVVALEVELEQADSLDAIFAREDRERHANL